MKLYKITTITTLAIALSLGVAAIAHAQEGRPPKADAIRAQVEAKREDRSGKPLEKIAEDRRGPSAKLASTSSSSPMFKKIPGLREEVKKRMEAKQFENRRNALLKELTKSLERLQDIITRIESRIAKAESSGRNMTEPKALLVMAKEKVEKAKAEVATFRALTASSTPPVATSTPPTGTTTPEIDLAKPRQLGDAAIKAVKDARDALQKVVVSIAQNMGLGKGKTATSTPPVASTTPPTATSTATTTNP